MSLETAAISALITERLAARFRDFVKEIEVVSPDEAGRYARDDWPTHRWGIGQNGSIAGIVYHVAAWKQMTLPLLRGEPAISSADFDADAFPTAGDWPGLVAWYKCVGAEWVETVRSLSADDFDSAVSWEGMTITMTKLILEISDHDLQHASQVEYLRQRLLVNDCMDQ